MTYQNRADYLANDLPTGRVVDLDSIVDDKCTICLEDDFTNPVRLACGHLFCHGCIEDHFKSYFRCPLCREPLFTMFNPLRRAQAHEAYSITVGNNQGLIQWPIHIGNMLGIQGTRQATIQLKDDLIMAKAFLNLGEAARWQQQDAWGEFDMAAIETQLLAMATLRRTMATIQGRPYTTPENIEFGEILRYVRRYFENNSTDGVYYSDTSFTAVAIRIHFMKRNISTRIHVYNDGMDDAAGPFFTEVPNHDSLFGDLETILHYIVWRAELKFEENPKTNEQLRGLPNGYSNIPYGRHNDPHYYTGDNVPLGEDWWGIPPGDLPAADPHLQRVLTLLRQRIAQHNLENNSEDGSENEHEDEDGDGGDGQADNDQADDDDDDEIDEEAQEFYNNLLAAVPVDEIHLDEDDMEF